ncbi:MAG TPA: DUF2007 domain-containing protein [Planctomycetota bacterium]|nr:DUF2007 domain-containing protein [Planctomycetota bacterium]
MAKEEKTCMVREVESELEGQIFEDLLQEAGIPAMVSAIRDTAFDGMEASGKGWGRILVLVEDREAARKLIEEYLSSLEKKGKARKTRKK